MEDLPKAYSPGNLEKNWYRVWDDAGYFTAKADDRPMYCIVIPPPNVTGALHLGHALNNTLQDILTRYYRMNGFDCLWLPGTDHAGIATQNVVERQLHREGTNRHELGREKFIERVWAWKEQYGNRIIAQLKELGCSCDWSRTRFTLDDGLSRAVQNVFITLYKEGLIYRGEYIVNWCPRCHTALSDIEVEHQEHKGHFWHIRYPRADGKGHIVVATTRPETMLGDTGVAVHPDDERYRDLVGKTVILPLMDREIPVVADKHVDPAFGTGLVKVTPAHDPNDFLVGQRHNLELINIMNEDASLNENAGAYAGLDRYEARQRVVAELEAQGLMEKIEDHEHKVGHCYRCDSVVEPYVSPQWFVKMEPLAAPAIKVVEEGKVAFHPPTWANTYFEWLRNTRDWCISRQIWWGHRIPAYYCTKEECEEVVVAATAPDTCPACGAPMAQDEDVLDTWFSSALWPFSTMGWPDETPELKKFYPNSVLSTAFDIIYFWVARMIVMGVHFMDDVPFRDVYIHALIRTETGEKMSKSSGNQIDPLDMIRKYGCDALRFTLTALAAQGRDIKLAESRIEGYRHFVNKLWNAARFCLMNEVAGAGAIDKDALAAEDHWILSELDTAIAATRQGIETYRFNDYAQSVYEFTWHKLCDWYLEMAKSRLTGDDAASAANVRAVLKHVLRAVLELLHPVMPFVTEEIWQKLRGAADPASIMIAPYPAVQGGWDGDAVVAVARLQEVIGAVRNIRGELRVPPKMEVELVTDAAATDMSIIAEGLPHLRQLANVKTVRERADDPPRPAAVAVLNGLNVWVPLTGIIDIDGERGRLEKEQQNIESHVTKLAKKLANEDYTSRAPEEVVRRDRDHLAEAEERLSKVKEYLNALQDA